MKNARGVVGGIVAIIVSGVFFLIPFAFIVLTAAKDKTESALLEFSWPTNFVLFENLHAAFIARDYLMIIAFFNSLILTVVSVTALVIFSAMVAYVWQRRGGRAGGIVNAAVLLGLIVPPAVVPTVYVLQELGLSRRCPG